MDQRELLIKKLLYRSIHRGCKETDHLIGEFAKAKIESFDDETLKLFADFIVEDDLLIYDWILEKQVSPAKYKKTVEEIKEFHSV